MALNSGGQIDVVWVGYNDVAQSIVYTPTGGSQQTVALHWCETPTVAAADGSAIRFASIAPGSSVQITLSGNVWVTNVKVLQQG
jgi:hypothetical protein